MSRNINLVFVFTLTLLQTGTSNMPFTYNEKLSSETNDAPHGLCLATFSRELQNELELRVAYSRIPAGETVTSVTLRGSALPGSTGTLLYTLPITQFSTMKTGPLAVAIINDLLAGLLYVQIATTNYPNGLMRGQLLTDKSQDLPLSSVYSVGGVISPDRGWALVHHEKLPTGAVALTMYFKHNISPCTGCTVGIYNADLGQQGSIVLPVTLPATADLPITGLVIPAGVVADRFFSGGLFLAVRRPVGTPPEELIRGQIDRIVHHYATLSNSPAGSQSIEQGFIWARGTSGDNLPVGSTRLKFHWILSAPFGTQMHIHVGVIGTTGGIQAEIAAPVPQTGRKEISLSGQNEKLANLGLYIDVHSAARVNPQAEIRGQFVKAGVVPAEPVYFNCGAKMSFMETTFGGLTSLSPGKGTVLCNYTPPNISCTVTYSEEQLVVSAQLKGDAFPGLSAPQVMYSFTDTKTAPGDQHYFSGSWQVSPEHQKIIMSGRAYFVLTTAKNPTGWLRGQFQMKNMLEVTLDNSQIQGTSPTTGALGHGLVFFEPQNGSVPAKLVVNVHHTVSAATKITLEAPAYITPIYKKYFYANGGGAPTRGFVSFDSANAAARTAFENGELSLNIYSTANPNGEIRGEISGHFSHYAYMTAMYNLPQTAALEICQVWMSYFGSITTLNATPRVKITWSCSGTVAMGPMYLQIGKSYENTANPVANPPILVSAGTTPLSGSKEITFIRPEDAAAFSDISGSNMYLQIMDPVVAPATTSATRIRGQVQIINFIDGCNSQLTSLCRDSDLVIQALDADPNTGPAPGSGGANCTPSTGPTPVGGCDAATLAKITELNTKITGLATQVEVNAVFAQIQALQGNVKSICYATAAPAGRRLMSLEQTTAVPGRQRESSTSEVRHMQTKADDLDGNPIPEVDPDAACAKAIKDASSATTNTVSVTFIVFVVASSLLML